MNQLSRDLTLALISRLDLGPKDLNKALARKIISIHQTLLEELPGDKPSQPSEPPKRSGKGRKAGEGPTFP